MRANKTLDEPKRLKALEALNILDSQPEAQFDDLVKLAAVICDVPTAMVSLVDEDRQWFKAKQGISLSQTDLDTSVCAHTILGDELTVINDTSKDERTKSMPMEKYGLKMGFYAGAPLDMGQGLNAGALCVLDEKPRELSEFQLFALKVLGDQVAVHLRARRKIEDIEEEKQELQQDLTDQEMLNQEIDHRVKNSLQLVTSMLRFQANASESSEITEALEMAQQRVSAIASVHAELDRSSDRDRINLASYITNLTADLSNTLPDSVSLSCSVPPSYVETKNANSIAIIYNEFVANSAKYAFPNGRKGNVKLVVAVDGKSATARLSDNGVGYSGDSGSRSSKGLGVRIMEAAARQVGDGLKYDDGEGGTSLTFEFPLAVLED